ncbi:MAG: UDP-N-acetylmuramate dehydrogenase [Thiohalophilus sp.]|nr:UDP-N-acetylmuramate dehydrogenase [Thiohalophilus sp.]MDR9435729.1 UDP-N-acetylmuramate dehydrogenase [Thiohalophilus sp.]
MNRTETEIMQLRGIMKQDEPMSRHTSWRVGGVAECFYQPADLADLQQLLQQLSTDEPLFWIGLGSNLLVRDGGFRGTVICTSGVLNRIEWLEGDRVYAEAGLASPQLARQTAKRGLRGAEFLCGIPGTFGGALAMNAGAMGGETWNIVESVQVIERQGNLKTRLAEEYETGYRQVSGPAGEWFVGATLKLEAGDAQEGLQKIKQHLARRGATQPTSQPTAGSVFRNPPGDYAARLIEQCGLKNTCIGGACVSEKHANFIINTGTATARDIELLMLRVADEVKQTTGIELIREVQIVGESDEPY